MSSPYHPRKGSFFNLKAALLVLTALTEPGDGMNAAAPTNPGGFLPPARHIVARVARTLGSRQRRGEESEVLTRISPLTG